MNAKTLVPCLSGLLLIAGCKDSPRQAEADLPPASARQVEQAGKDTRQAVQAAVEYGYAQKAEFADKVRGELADLNRRIDELGDRLDGATAETRAEAATKLAALRSQAKQLGEQLDQVKDASETKWAEVKSGIQKGWTELKDSVDGARQWLADKIAPAPPK